MSGIKRAAAGLAALCLLLSLCACSGGGEHKDDGKVTVVASAFVQYDFARAVAGERAEIKLLLKPGEEAHTYDPTPADMIAIADCDVFLFGGGESDSWIERVLDSVDTSEKQLVAMMDVCAAVEEETSEGMQVGLKDDDGEAEYDEHVWTSPKNAAEIVKAVCSALCAADPENAGIYGENAENYTEKLMELDAEFRDIADSCGGGTLIFGDRFPLIYFVREYGLDYYAAFPGCASNAEPSAKTVAFLTDRVREEKIPIVFQIELSNGKTAAAIAEGAGARVETFYTCQNISRDDFDAGETYLSIMSRNLETLKEALG